MEDDSHRRIKFKLNMWGQFSLRDSNSNYLYKAIPGESCGAEYIHLEI